MITVDNYFMKIALKEAIYAYEKNEIPVGAIIVFHRTIIAQSHNLTKKLKDITAHAEIQVVGMTELSLKKCNLYITLEPCNMCTEAIFLAKINNLVLGASKEKKNFEFRKLRYSLRLESSLLLKSFFKKKKKNSLGTGYIKYYK